MRRLLEYSIYRDLILHFKEDIGKNGVWQEKSGQDVMNLYIESYKELGMPSSRRSIEDDMEDRSSAL